MRLSGIFGTLGFQIAVAMSVLIVAIGALVLWQVDALLREHEEERYSESLLRASDQLRQELGTYQELAVTGAAVLASQPPMVEAIEARDPVAILQIAAAYYQQTGSALQGSPGLQVYDEDGGLIVRAHDPLRGSQAQVPESVALVLSSGVAIGVLRDDEVLDISVAGVAPVRDGQGAVIGAIEALTGVDRAFLLDFERLLGMKIAVITPERVVGTGSYGAMEPFEVDAEDRARIAAGEPVLLDLGGAPHLSVLIPLTRQDGEHIGDIYVGIEEAEILAGVGEVRSAAFRATAAGGVIAVALATGLAFVAVRPIRELVTAARRIQANDLDTPVATGGPSEVTDLADALEDLRLAVRQTREAMLSVNRDLASRFDASTESLSEVSQELAVMHGILAALGGEAAGGLTGVPDELTGLDWLDGAAIALATQEGRLSLAASSGLTPSAAAMLLAIVEAGVRGQRLESGMTVADTGATPETGPLASHSIAGFAAVPMVEPDGIAGIIVVTSRAPLGLTPSRTDLLRSVAREVAAMLERTELAGEVEENRRIAESVLREMSDGVLVINHADQCRVANPAAARILGRSRLELVGRSAADILPLGREAIETLRRRAASTSTSPVAPLLADAGGRKIAISAGPFVDVDPERSGMMVLMRDLTAEAEAERVKQDFVSMVGHELRTPLTLIRTTIDLLNEGDAGALNDTQARIVEVLNSNTDRLMMLINDLLDMSAIDSGRLQIQPQMIDLVEVARTAIEEAHPAAAAKQHQTHLSAPEQALAWADRRRISQVLANLISNAIKYTPPGGVVEVIVDPSQEDWLRVAVRDNGIGIPPEEQTQLFEKFYRTSQGRRTTGGTGLGLAIARSLVELHGGRIWSESDGQTGSTFAFTLPTRQI
ncbi:MAG: ATP-binding protein [Dehalococcoidia bacterium]